MLTLSPNVTRKRRTSLLRILSPLSNLCDRVRLARVGSFLHYLRQQGSWKSCGWWELSCWTDFAKNGLIILYSDRRHILDPVYGKPRISSNLHVSYYIKWIKFNVSIKAYVISDPSMGENDKVKERSKVNKKLSWCWKTRATGRSVCVPSKII